ncbi:DNA-binding LacI/PurR family transcriptional regulator [Microbacterium foliorum]|uniref:DNA-binding LacI/PurR family transcriptional regulator n=1 Tax=Microbacterium foliorum TaxID=104336 RepID=A0ABU1HVE5_9MICO|nr:LacI family DNA-binding transcriptional regulator [Microbacterium foliorum]MDR6144036.1 DNA-binding LacI/PurR family transcriptional regulator [Microbacterium foliorum]
MSEDRPRSVSMRDVAELAGVSGQTVSRVANDLGNVTARTRRRVELAMKELGYRPNFAARALRNGEFRSIAVVVFGLDTLGNVRTVSAIADEAARRSYAVELISVQHSPDESGTADFSWAMRRLGQDAVDGIILILETSKSATAALQLPPAVPAVIVDAGAAFDHPSVDTDQEQGARLAVDHLLSLGHETVWHIAGPAESNAAAARTRAWRTHLEEAGRAVPEPVFGDWTPASGYAAGRTLAAIPGVSAVFAANDQMALGALRAFHEQGLPVPGKISVVGFDDMLESAEFWPPLTTVRQHFETAGATAVALLVDQIERRDTPSGRRVIDTQLVVRASTASPRASHCPMTANL